MNAAPEKFDFTKLADNGLRRGFTTGSCAAAAAKAAALMLVRGEKSSLVDVCLPGGTHFAEIAVQGLQVLQDGSVRADVVKKAGDDPDQTDGATIFAIVRKRSEPGVKFLAGHGVGTVTEPGIRVPVGEPAINPVPRKMIEHAINEAVAGPGAGVCLFAETPPSQLAHGFEVAVGCENGETIALKTFNPRLGIKGGISILGTTGIVEPMSLSAYMASIEVYIRVALADATTAAYLPGNIGLGYAKNVLGLSQKQIVHISNFVGFSLECTSTVLAESDSGLARLYLLGHPGKLAKLLDNVWDTHSSRSTMAMSAVAEIASELPFSQSEVDFMRSANTVEAIVDQFRGHELERQLWAMVTDRIAERARTKLSGPDQFFVRLFDMQGNLLGYDQ